MNLAGVERVKVKKNTFCFISNPHKNGALDALSPKFWNYIILMSSIHWKKIWTRTVFAFFVISV